MIIELSRNKKLQNYRIILSQYTIYTNDLSTLWHVYYCHVYFVFLNMCNPRTTFYDGLAHLAGSFPCDQKFSCKWNLSFFKAVPSNRLPLYMGSSLHIINSLSSHFYLFQNAILHRVLNFKSIFLRMQFSLIATFFSLVSVICFS